MFGRKQLTTPSRAIPIGICSLFAALITTGCTKPLTSIEQLERGIMLAQREQFPESLQYFNAAIEQEPGNPDVYYERAVVYAQMGKESLALADYGEAVRLAPEFLLAYNNRAILLHQDKQHEACISDCRLILQLDPGYAPAFQLRSESYQALGEFEKALADAERYVELADTAQGHVLHGTLLANMGRAGQAIASFDRAIEQAPQMAVAWLRRGIAKTQMHQFEEAKLDFAQAAALDTQIITDDLIGALTDLTVPPATVSIDRERAVKLLTDMGWKVVENETGVFPYTIRQSSGESRNLLLVARDAKGGRINLPGDQYLELLQTEGLKSLLVALPTEAGKHRWQFIEDWNPTREDSRNISVSLTVDESDGNEIIQTEASDHVLVSQSVR